MLHGKRLRVVGLWLGWGLVRAALFAALAAGIGALLDAAPGLFGGGLRLAVGLTALLLGLWAALNAVLSALCNGALADLLTRLYVEVTGETPPERVPLAALRMPGLATLGLVAALLVGGGLVFADAILDRVAGQREVAIIAHRGAAGARPENTMAAVRKALDDRADWVEIDVQETADGEVVVAHDSDFMKLAGVELKVWDATMADLAEIDIGSWYDPAYADARTPTLREVLQAANGRGRVMIELKYYGHDVRLEQRVAEIVEEEGMAEQVAVMSLKRAGIEKMHALRPGWRTGLLAARALGDLSRLDVDFLAVNTGQVSLGMIRRAHQAGKDVYVWTVDDPMTMSRMISMGVDGLITNEPALAREVMEARNALNAPERLALWLADSLRLDKFSLTAPESDA
jgi:glycerophosphoryl diester phosphodiesterase